MRLNLRRYSKETIIWLSENKCRHGHTYLEHPQCFFDEHPEMAFSGYDEKIAFLDIEAGGGLDADFAVMISWCLKPLDGEVIWDAINRRDIEQAHENKEFDKPDKRIVEHLIDEIQKHNRIVTHYGSRFDLPFIRTRALYLGLDFPEYGTVYQDDTWVWAKNKLKLHSNRLESIAQLILGDSEKTKIKYKYWIGALYGDEESLGYIVEHNKIDVIELEKVWKQLVKYVKPTRRSI